jgi:hypothetical protein
VVDDRGNRYRIEGRDDVRGIGVLEGNSPDTKFTLSGGERGDARFEFRFYSPREILGTRYEIDLTLREIEPVTTTQWKLGREHVLHFTGFSDSGVVSQQASPSPATNAAQPAPAPPKPRVNPMTDPCTGRSQCYWEGPVVAEVVTLAPVRQGEPRAFANVRLTNVSNLPLLLAYTNNSAGVIDDAGNRYTAQSIVGLPKVNDPNGVQPAELAPGESRNAVLMVSAPASTREVGTRYSLNMAVTQLEATSSRQFVLGREFAIGIRDVAPGTLKAAPLQPPSEAVATLCAGKENQCATAGPFVAEVVRLTDGKNGDGARMTVRLHVTNVSSSPIILGYEYESDALYDDAGVRYLVPVRHVTGIGSTSESRIDVSFRLAPGEARDATFEFDAPFRARLGSTRGFHVALSQLEILPSKQVRTAATYAFGFSGLKTSAVGNLKEGISNIFKRPPK